MRETCVSSAAAVKKGTPLKSLLRLLGLQAREPSPALLTLNSPNKISGRTEQTLGEIALFSRALACSSRASVRVSMRRRKKCQSGRDKSPDRKLGARSFAAADPPSQ